MTKETSVEHKGKIIWLWSWASIGKVLGRLHLQQATCLGKEPRYKGAGREPKGLTDWIQVGRNPSPARKAITQLPPQGPQWEACQVIGTESWVRRRGGTHWKSLPEARRQVWKSRFQQILHCSVSHLFQPRCVYCKVAPLVNCYPTLRLCQENVLG